MDEPKVARGNCCFFQISYSFIHQVFIVFQLVIDFEHLYPAEAQKLITSWPDVRKNIERLALNSRESVKDPIGIELVQLLKGEDGRIRDGGKLFSGMARLN